MIPESIAEVTPEWLGDCLGQPVAALAREQIGQGIGIMGEIYRVSLRYDEPAQAAPASVVVKLPSRSEDNRAQGVALGMFEAEVRFYRELASKVAVGLPAIYHSAVSPGTANFVIVMEDLTAMRTIPQAQGMTAGQATAAVQVMAHVHATWWNQVRDGSMDWIPDMTGPRIEHLIPVLTARLDSFLEAFADELPAGGAALYELFPGHYLQLMRAFAARSPWTLAHQDFRVENLLVAETGEVVVIDWQGIGRGPGAYDLSYCLGGSMPSALRREHETRLLETYHEQLCALGVRDYAFEDLTRDYAHAHLLGGLATALLIGGGMDMSNERGKELVVTMARRHVAAALDHGGVDLLHECIR